MTPRTGRPPVENPRTETVRFRLTADELSTVEAAASRAGQGVTDYARAALLSKAKRQR